MDSNEAIMENENNTNRESQSSREQIEHDLCSSETTGSGENVTESSNVEGVPSRDDGMMESSPADVSIPSVSKDNEVANDHVTDAVSSDVSKLDELQTSMEAHSPDNIQTSMDPVVERCTNESEDNTGAVNANVNNQGVESHSTTGEGEEEMDHTDSLGDSDSCTNEQFNKANVPTLATEPLSSTHTSDIHNAEPQSLVVKDSNATQNNANEDFGNGNVEATPNEDLITNNVLSSENMSAIDSSKDKCVMEESMDIDAATDNATDDKDTDEKTCSEDNLKGLPVSSQETFNTVIEKPGVDIGNDKSVAPESIKDTSEAIIDTAVSLEKTIETVVLSESVKDTTVTSDSTQDTSVSSEGIKDPAVSSEATIDTPLSSESTALSSKSTIDSAVSSENTIDTAVSSESTIDTAVTSESINDKAVSLESMKDTTVTSETTQNTSVSSESIKDTPVSSESMEDTTVTSESIEDTTVTSESMEGTTVTSEIIEDTVVASESMEDAIVTPESTKDASITSEGMKDATVTTESTQCSSESSGSTQNTAVSSDTTKDTTVCLDVRGDSSANIHKPSPENTKHKDVSSDASEKQSSNENGQGDQHLNKEASTSSVYVKKERVEAETPSSETATVQAKNIKNEPHADETSANLQKKVDDIVILDDEEDNTKSVKSERAETNAGKTDENGSTDKNQMSSKPPEGTKPAKKDKKSKTQTCIVCGKVGRCKYNIVRNGDVKHLCDDVCFKKFRSSPSQFLKYKGGDNAASDAKQSTEGKTSSPVLTSKDTQNTPVLTSKDTQNTPVNLQAKSNQAITCDQCKKIVPAQYHLTMSDASVRNFCSYPCVIAFQAQFTAKPQSALGSALGPSSLLHQQQQQALQQQAQAAAAAAAGRRSGRIGTRAALPQQPVAMPVISSVVSLAPATQKGRPKKAQSNAQENIESKELRTADRKSKIILQDPPPKEKGEDKELQCRPQTQETATSCRPQAEPIEVQTDDVEPEIETVYTPVPVPIYIPMPTNMFSSFTPELRPVPIPIPVPIFIPSTRKYADKILDTIQEIAERVPADPLEAEILAMAEAISGAKTGDSDTDEYENEDYSADTDVRYDKRKELAGGEEDMIQMALRMAEEMSEKIEDLETNVEPVAVSNEPPPQPPQPPEPELHHHINSYRPREDDYMARSNRGRGAKRPNRGRTQQASRPKRPRVERNLMNYQEVESAVSSIVQQPPPPKPVIQEPPADENYRLKFTYGVNAWQHWVIAKNVEIEKTAEKTKSTRIMTFPTDILKTTADQLNFTLCMFIKEVRKPNGDPYSPDSVYYLCLGIQQYLYENGRIDNIFTDLYFERFTNCLHDVLKTLQPKVNAHGQTLCRIEEEHLWESKQLGAHSPYVLLNTLVYFHTKHFILKTAQDHMSLSFAQILKHLKKGVPGKGNVQNKNVALRYYCLANGKKGEGFAARKSKEGVPVYEVTENFENPLRCPVKLYEFFLSKCPESIKNRHDIFYPVPERSCVPDSPVWYSTQAVDQHTMDKMLTRTLLVREIQESHLHAQPMYL